MNNEYEAEPWYRQFWPWFVIGLPAIVVVASLVTVGIAFKHADDLVADDYYKEGLAINRHLESQDMASTLGLSGEVELQDDTIIVTMQGDLADPNLTLTLAHPMESSEDRILHLQRIETGLYAAPLSTPISGSWHWSITPSSGKLWRLDGRLAGLEQK